MHLLEPSSSDLLYFYGLGGASWRLGGALGDLGASKSEKTTTATSQKGPPAISSPFQGAGEDWARGPGFLVVSLIRNTPPPPEAGGWRLEAGGWWLVAGLVVGLVAGLQVRLVAGLSVGALFLAL